MNKQEQKKNKFHLKIDAEMKECLKKLPLFKKAGNISNLLSKVLVLLSPGIEKMHLEGDQHHSRYKFVSENKEVARKSIYIDLPGNVYRQLKLLHQDLNFYSMAQLLRLIIRMFLVLAVELGDAVESKLLELYLKWKKERDSIKQALKPVEQLLLFIYQEPQESLFLTLYSRKFQPIGIYRL